jgi:hypothetical protein
MDELSDDITEKLTKLRVIPDLCDQNPAAQEDFGESYSFRHVVKTCKYSTLDLSSIGDQQDHKPLSVCASPRGCLVAPE